jgi:hypothetical protein
MKVGLSAGARSGPLRVALESEGYAVVALPDAADGFANAVLGGALEFDGCVITGQRFRAAPAEAILKLVSARRPVVSAYSVDATGTEQNPRAFLYHADLFKYLFRHGGRAGEVRDIDSGNRLPFRHFRALAIAPLTSVGEDLLYVDRSVAAAGIRFPHEPYKLHTGSTAFALMARDRGFEVCGLPNLEVTVAP